ncbi:TPA: type 1 fimbrial protein [Salmonella enterica]|uniref:fimbrial protein n=1 Tax=Salmonella enterica TaxID=28901 RepID=UPI000B7BC83E|nr:fimbrial protein [Salmonella enterica]ECC9150635.1 type 1 fimbrial protein [Salmonella enterica subsp. salamae]ASO11788.1 fimbrial protein [Salmonella enterica subsp. salamae serovar 57:z29:z42]ECE5991217.1 type 1 fimbrial protein [Salmonella enterica subsp. salamae]ECE6744667.1 type 1 fimbrial protein [Salmonella enterica subsp. salamae]ECG0941456.1 type 1 fimbrial protein [Salmonella enterica subsp. salamae]
MNKKLLSIMVFGAMISAGNMSAMAASTGTVNFSGRIVADTCEINVDDSGSNTVMVTFADTYPADYSGDGSVGTSKDFKIELTKCDPAIAGLNLMFSGDTSDANNLRLQNSIEGNTGAASNVGITVTSKNGTGGAVVFDGSVPDKNTDVANGNTGDEGTATPTVFNYTANVIQTGDIEPTAGQYAASADFTVFYR